MRHSGRSSWSFGTAVLLAGTVLWALLSCRKETQEPAPVEAVRSLAAIVATCASAEGDVQVRRAGGTDWEPVRAGAVFREGDEVKTASLSTARLEFLEGGGLEMEERTSVIIDLAPPAAGAAAGSGERRVALKEGVLRGMLPRAAEGAARAGLVINTGDGGEVRLAGRPGEESTVRISRKDRGVELAALAGNVAVLTGKEKTDLQAGNVAMVASGQLTDLAKLIDFPQSVEPGIDARFRFTSDLAIHLVWNAVPGAASYRVQVAQDLSFQRIEKVQDVEGTQVRYAPAGTGARAWRVASRDAYGRLGEYGFARRFHCEEPRDLLIGPADGAVVKLGGHSQMVTFSWQSPGEGRSCRVVVAGGPNLLEQMVTSQQASGQRAELKLSEPGEYWWGVYEEGGKELVPLFSAPRRFSLQRPARPKVKLPRAISNWGD